MMLVFKSLSFALPGKTCISQEVREIEYIEIRWTTFCPVFFLVFLFLPVFFFFFGLALNKNDLHLFLFLGGFSKRYALKLYKRPHFVTKKPHFKPP